ncbi:F-box domain [Macleaya cordata]|uniref:F-box domain n=1 Tax=Macleaya cordata TaxID=56857 RepID=A0A200R855_MACCD|nr:F-box domain [Macleaya cordata]
MENLLPEEIITDIISRLPVESILECRRVCKNFKTLLHHPFFAHLHLLRHSHSLLLDDDDDDLKYHSHSYTAAASFSKVGFITLWTLEDNRCHLYWGEYDDKNNECYNTLKKINHPSLKRSILVGSCNGLLCVGVERYRVSFDPDYICNPITREYVNLPKLTEKHGDDRIVSGFGYHPKTNEYKVVRIYYDADQPSVGQVQVYTLGAGTGWRNKVEIKYRLRHSFVERRGILANGALYWLFEKGLEVVSFDLADEEFRLLPSPPISGSLWSSVRLLGLGGLLGLAQLTNNGRYIQIWSLKNNKESSGNYDIMNQQEYQSWSWSLEFTSKFDDMYQPFSITSSVPHMNSFISLKALGEDAKIIGSTEGVIEPELNQYIAEDEDGEARN